MDVDAIIVGAGVVGLACARSLAQAGRSVVVLEKETRIGQGVSSRNSEVIHAGLHYAPGSLKARLCVAGRRALCDYLPARGVAHERCGKLIVATSEAEIAALEALMARGIANGVGGLRMLTSAEARAREPQIACAAAIHSPDSGILEAHGLMLALQGEIEDAGGAIALAAPFAGAVREAGGWRVRVGGEAATTLLSERLIIAAGLGAQACARAVEGFAAALIPKLHYGKGNYFALTGPAPFRMLIYPAPAPGSLGLHYKRDLGGRAHFGPDLEFVETEDYAVNEARAPLFYEFARRFWPGLKDGALSPDYAGIRPKLHGPGEAQGDFIIAGEETHGLRNLVALFGIESPGLTCSLALGDHVAALLEERA
ncbi:MAG: NAD(P)/FAD-dependent oxidoreductase [Hydrogenophilaceae bacterium]|jgi:L-2-hydroxyglutarate oxidase LhgO|nr:NAD(P)/FAD-dependent oxidoreductase [Hydrogenophilaceae bacterium]